MAQMNEGSWIGRTNLFIQDPELFFSLSGVKINSSSS